MFKAKELRLKNKEELEKALKDQRVNLADLNFKLVGSQVKKVSEFGLEVIVELSKVTWPTRKETVVSTGVIVVMVAIAAVLMFGIDALWGTLTSYFLEF